ncbi:MAG: hypothetical protein FWD40_05880 [Treponema sp.]|nr:hypothetical protein [Treponema sp.]
MAGLGVVIWKVAVALYLMATGVLGLSKAGDLNAILGAINLSNSIVVVIAGVIALIAGIFLLLELFNIKIAILDTLIFIIAIIWAIFIVLLLIQWIVSGFAGIWTTLQMLGTYVMVLASLLIASKRFG